MPMEERFGEMGSHKSLSSGRACLSRHGRPRPPPPGPLSAPEAVQSFQFSEVQKRVPVTGDGKGKKSDVRHFLENNGNAKTGGEEEWLGERE